MYAASQAMAAHFRAGDAQVCQFAVAQGTQFIHRGSYTHDVLRGALQWLQMLLILQTLGVQSKLCGGCICKVCHVLSFRDGVVIVDVE